MTLPHAMNSVTENLCIDRFHWLNYFPFRVQELQLELSTLQRQHSDIAAQSKQKNESLIANHHIEMENLKETQTNEIDSMKQKIHKMENEILRLQAEKSTVSRSASDANRGLYYFVTYFLVVGFFQRQAITS